MIKGEILRRKQPWLFGNESKKMEGQRMMLENVESRIIRAWPSIWMWGAKEKIDYGQKIHNYTLTFELLLCMIMLEL